MKRKNIFVSKKAQNHSSKGDFVYPKKHLPKRVLTMKSGGHGQENIVYLSKHKLSFDIDTEFDNGVRLGHIERHEKKRDKKQNGHAWFPSNWDRNDIKKAGQHVASLKRNKVLLDGKRHTGRYQGVTIGIIARNGIIKTIFPAFDVNKHAKKTTHIIFKK